MLFLAMTEKKDIRGYVNPDAPGRTVSGQRAAMTGEVYTEDRHDRQIDALIRSVRKGSVVQVEELYCLAPGIGRIDRRRRLLAERIEAIKDRGGVIHEIATGMLSNKRLPAMMLRAYEMMATSGRARHKGREGRPDVWPKSGQEYEGYRNVWHSRLYQNDDERRTAIKKRFGKSPSNVWLRQQFGSPSRGKQLRDKE